MKILQALQKECLEKTAVTVKTISDNLQGACTYMPASTLQPPGGGTGPTTVQPWGGAPSM